MSWSVTLCALALSGLFYAPTGIGIGATPADRSGSPTDGKVAERAGPITALAVAPDGLTVLSGDANGRLTCWSVRGGKLEAVTQGKWEPERAQPPAIEALLWTDGAIWLATDEGTLAHVRDGGARIVEVARHAEGSRGLVAGPDGLIASAGQSGDVRIYDAQGGLVEAFQAHEVSTAALASEGGKKPRLWSVGWDGRLCAWRWPKPGQNTKPKKAGFRGSASSSRAGASKLAKPLLELELGQREPTGLALVPAPEGARDSEPVVFVSDFQGLIKRVEVAKRKLSVVALPSRTHMELLTGFALAPGGARVVAVASAEQTLLALDPSVAADVAPRVVQKLAVPPARACFANAKTLVVGRYDGQLELVEVE